MTYAQGPVNHYVSHMRLKYCKKASLFLKLISWVHHCFLPWLLRPAFVAHHDVLAVPWDPDPGLSTQPLVCSHELLWGPASPEAGLSSEMPVEPYSAFSTDGSFHSGWLALPSFCRPAFGEWVDVSGHLPPSSFLPETRVAWHMTSSFFAGLVTRISSFAPVEDRELFVWLLA